MTIDVHAHWLPEAIDRILVDRYKLNVMLRPLYVPVESPVSDSDEDLDRRVQLMDAAGVQLQVASIAHLPYVDDEAELVNLVRLANDAQARIVHERPDRFMAFGELPLPFVDASVAEFRRCIDDLGLVGAKVSASYRGVSAVAETFDPLFDVMNKYGALVFFHPRGDGLCSPLITEYQLSAPLGVVLEDTVLVTQMVSREFPIRYADLRIVVPHLGGLLPIYLERLDNQIGRAFPGLAEGPSTMVRRLWFDTAVHGSRPALAAAASSLGEDRLVPGSDFPAMEHFEQYRSSFQWLAQAGLEASQVQKILHVNPFVLLGLSSAGDA